ncbi:sodium-independent sulfate anion transporter-like isoform X2 [Artemia franciscana]|uniref:sodium-independent sulfate anion transporter-like isoform X2 n=1 Tax=Artemia franciscana TaxID=6661 RepID=UPI0032DAB01F
MSALTASDGTESPKKDSTVVDISSFKKFTIPEEKFPDVPKEPYYKRLSKQIFRKKTLYKRLPILRWVKEYKLSYIVPDFIAGLSVGLTLVPQGIAYAIVAGLPPQYGLYASIMGCYVYALLGSTPYLAIGPTALLSISTYSAASVWGPSAAIFLCFMSGIIETLLGIFNLGFLLDFISPTVIDGFTSAAALTISSTQLGSLFGFSVEGEGFFETLIEFFHHIGELKVPDTIMGITSLICLFGMKYIGTIKLTKEGILYTILNKSMWFIGVARNAIIVLVCAGIAAGIGDPDKFRLVGNITAGLPPFSPPPFQILNETTGEVILGFGGLLQETSFSIIIIPIIAILEAVAISKAFAKGKKLDVSQEMIAVGVSNILGSFVSSYPVTGSFSRTAVNANSGVKTPISCAITGTLVVLAVAFLTPYFYYITKSSLAAVIIAAVISMIEYHVVLPMWRTNKVDLVPLFTTFIAGLIVGLELAIIIGAVVHILIMSFGNARPRVSIYVSEKDDANTVVVRPKENLVFPSSDYFVSLVKKRAKNAGTVNTVVLDLTLVSRLDYAGAKMLKSLSDEFTKSDIEVVATNLSREVKKTLTGIRAKNLKIIE